MIRVLVSDLNSQWPLQRQTPGQTGQWGRYQFLLNQSVDECDIWIVLENVPAKMTVRCPPENTLLVLFETEEIHRYSSHLTRQFAQVLTFNALVRHPHAIRSQAGLPWHVGIEHPTFKATLNYDDLKAMTSVPKTKLLSMVCSNKAITPAHRARIVLAHKLLDHFGDRIDVFGKEFKPLPDKWDSVYSYQYQVVIENAAKTDYWTEKLADCYLGMAFPFYWGCPNVNQYFSSDAYELIDLYSPEQVIQTIESAIERDLYASRLSAVSTAKSLILDEYNLFATLARICDRMVGKEKKAISLSPEPHPMSWRGRVELWSNRFTDRFGFGAR